MVYQITLVVICLVQHLGIVVVVLAQHAYHFEFEVVLLEFDQP